MIAQVESKSRSREEARLEEAAVAGVGKSLQEIMDAGGDKSYKIKVGTGVASERVAPASLCAQAAYPARSCSVTCLPRDLPARLPAC